MSVACGASILADDFMTMVTANKYSPNGPSTPTGWTALGQYAGGVSGTGTQTGIVIVGMFSRISDGTESGTSVTVSVPSGNACVGGILTFRKTAGSYWEVSVAVGGSDNTFGLSWVIAADGTLDVQAGDVVIVGSAVNRASGGNTTAEALAVGDATFTSATERFDNSTLSGDDVGFFVSSHVVAAGTTAIPAYTATHSISGGSSPAGATIMIRLREVLSAGEGAGTSDGAGVAVDPPLDGVGAGIATSSGVGIASDAVTPPSPEPTGINVTQGVAVGRNSLRRIGKMDPIRTGQAVIDRAQDQVVSKLNQLLEHPLVEAIPVEVTLQAGLNKIGHGASRVIRKMLWSCDADGAVISSRQSDNPHPDRDFWVWLAGADSAKAVILLIPGI